MQTDGNLLILQAMIKKRVFSQVNWIDGMKISKDHFIQSENNLVELIQDAAALNLNSYNYGLLPAEDGEGESLELEVLQVGNGSIKSRLALCRAVTSGGCRIELSGELRKEVVSENFKIDNRKEAVYFIIVSANYTRRIPVGIPDPNEVPARHPHVIEDYTLSILSEDDMNANQLGANHLPIGRIVNKAGEWLLDKDYIPPCTSVVSHRLLVKIYKVLGKQFFEISNCALRVVQKVVSRGQTSSLALNVKAFSFAIASSFGQEVLHLRHIAYNHPPLLLIEKYYRLVSGISLNLEALPVKERDDMVAYFAELLEIRPVDINELITQVLEIEYDHTDCFNSLVPVQSFSNIFASLFEKLDKREEIGKRVERDLFIRSTVETEQPKPKRKPNIFLE